MRKQDIGWSAAGYATIAAALVAIFFIGGVVEVVHFIFNFAFYGAVLALLRGLVNRLSKTQPAAVDKNVPWYIAAALSFLVALSSALGSPSQQSSVSVTSPVTEQRVIRHSHGFSYVANSSWIQANEVEEGEVMQASLDTAYAVHLFDGKTCVDGRPAVDLECYKGLLRRTYATMSDSPELLGAEIVELSKGTVYAITYYLPGVQAEGDETDLSSLTVYLPMTTRTFVAKCWVEGQRGVSDQKRERVFQLVESMVVE
jgi:hypothetical protein